MLISPAYAQAAAGIAGKGGLLTQMMPLLLIFVVFYFLLIRPQQKKQKMHKQMLGAIRRGDRIVTGGGILGTVTKVVSDDELQVEIADGVKVRVDRGLVSNVAAKTDPADKARSSKDEDDSDAPSDGDSNAPSDDDSNAPSDDQKEGKLGGLKKLLGG